jgi:hypothetical protein
MDGTRFDALARFLTTLTSRRKLAGITIAGTLGVLLGDAATAATCLRPGRSCSRTNPKRAKCCGGAKCRGGRCRCPKGRRACGRSCCAAGQSCLSGQCVTLNTATCPGGQTACPGGCVDLQSDSQACGSCTNVCASDRACTSGSCVCQGSMTDCAGDCVLLAVDVGNCGACGNQCPLGEVCGSGACCIRAANQCVTTDDRCCGNSFCKVSHGTVGQCCQVGGGPCNSDALCCSGRCQPGFLKCE